MNIPRCAKCNKPVDGVTISPLPHLGIVFSAICHGEIEHATVPISYLKLTQGKAKIEYGEAFTGHKETTEAGS